MSDLPKTCDHEWAFECDRQLCTICGELRPYEQTINELLAERTRLIGQLSEQALTERRARFVYDAARLAAQAHRERVGLR